MSEEYNEVSNEVSNNNLKEVAGGFQQGYYDFDEGDCFSWNDVWFYKVLKAAHHIKGNTYVYVRTYKADKTTVYSESNHEAYKFDSRKFLGNNVF